MIHFKIKIELKSDLCAQSGSGHGSYIDSDVCFDKLGFPYIPAKRLKGCLADAANELIDWASCTEEDKKRLFGETGLNEGGSFSISNAYITNYKEIYNQLDERNSKAENKNGKHKKTDNQLGEEHNEDENRGEKHRKIERSDIINFFTSTRTRTAINETSGTAKDGSLRTIRVINCIDPMKNKEKVANLKDENGNEKASKENNENNINMVFISEASLSAPEDDDKDIKILGNCCKALRHIGSHRTRGFGAVKLSLDKEDKPINKNKITISDNCKKIKLQIRLDSPIMISSNKSSESMDYIPGSTILGYFAGQYLRNKKDEEEFYRLFVNGQEGGLKFSNFYISDKNNTRYFPAPITCKKEKISDGIYYNSVFNSENNTPSKSLTNKYIRDIDIKSFDKFSIKINSEGKCNKQYKINKERLIEIEKEVFYHHARPIDDDGKKLEDKAIDKFYQYNAISADQYFIGEIEGSNEGLKKIVELLNENNCKMRIGKSKTAQYGSVTVVKYKEEASNEIKITVNENTEFAVVAQSHIMLLDDKTGGNIIKPEEIGKRIAEELFKDNDENKYCKKTSFIKIDQIGGYNRKWNLERPPVPAIASGSVFTFKYMGGKKEINKYISIGERQHEGLGRMYVWIKEDAVSNDLQALKEKDWISTLENKNITTNTDKTENQNSETMLNRLINNIKRQENLLKLKKKAFANAERLNKNSGDIKKEDRLEINSTTINNLLVKYMNGEKYSRIKSFVDSIKDKEKRDKVEKLLFEDIENNSSVENSSKNKVDSGNEEAGDNSNSNNTKDTAKINNSQKIELFIKGFDDVKQESQSTPNEDNKEKDNSLLEYYLKYYYINLLTQCKLNIRINGNEKGGENNG